MKQSNELIRSYKANNPIYDMSFNYIGDKLSLATMDSQLYLLDIRVQQCFVYSFVLLLLFVMKNHFSDKVLFRGAYPTKKKSVIMYIL